MKKILITLALFAGLFTYTNGQGNLQFNQARYIKLTGVATSSYAIVDTFDLVVPANKVLKIESASANGLTSGSPTNIPTDFASEVAAVSLDGVIISSTARGSGYNMTRPLPIWLPEGTYKLALVAFTSVTSKGFVSAIEYNIVQ